MSHPVFNAPKGYCWASDGREMPWHLFLDGSMSAVCGRERHFGTLYSVSQGGVAGIVCLDCVADMFNEMAKR